MTESSSPPSESPKSETGVNSFKALVAKGVIGAVSVAGATAIPILVQRQLTPPPVTSPEAATPAQIAPASVMPAQQPTVTSSPEASPVASPVADPVVSPVASPPALAAPTSVVPAPVQPTAPMSPLVSPEASPLAPVAPESVMPVQLQPDLTSNPTDTTVQPQDDGESSRRRSKRKKDKDD